MAKNFWSLRNKGIAFIMLPLLLQAIISILLTVSIYQEQQAAVAEAKAKNAILHSSQIIKRTTKIFLAANVYRRTKGKLGQRFGKDQMLTIGADIEELISILEKREYQKKNIEEIRNKEMECVQYFSEIKNGTGNKERERMESAALLKVPDLLQSIRKAIIDEVKHSKFKESRSEKRKQVGSTLTMVLVANGLALILLPIAFSKTILNRIARLSRKTIKLSHRESLGEPDNAHDEIASLDKFLHRADQEISQTLANEKSTVENSADPILSTDQEGIISQVNNSAARLIGYTFDELVDKTIFDLVEEEQLTELRDKVSSLIAESKSQSFELPLKDKTGKKIDVLWSLYTNQTDDTVFIVLHDLREEKEVERLKEDFVASISHDLRTPLTSIENAISLILLGALGELDKESKTELETAQRNTNRLIKLINDLLDFEKLKSGRMQISKEKILISALVDEALESVQGIGKKKNISIEKEDLDQLVYADKDRIIQVLVNLISNAIKFSSEDGVVRVSARPIDRGVQILVGDNGPGIPEDMQDKIFEAYEQVDIKRDTAKKGTGLGLAIAGSIVKEHGGDIGVFSQLEFGSTFWFTLPDALD